MKLKNLSIILIISILSSNITAQNYQKIAESCDIYNALIRELAINYVDTIDYEEITHAGISRMLQTLDPYTTFYAQSEEETLKMMTTGSYGGIGAIITPQGDRVAIMEPYEGMPAQRNDVRVGDILLKVNGKDTKGLKTNDVSQLLRGPQGTEVELVLQRQGEKKPITKKFVRELIQIAPIEYYTMLSDTIGYISLRDFTENSSEDFRNALIDLKRHNDLRKLIIDLRNNGGGLVSEAVNIASLFVPKNTTIVSMKGLSPQSENIYKTANEPQFPELPLMFLVNSSSASASEILAGSMQDLDRAVIVGERSFGKGLVQNVRRLPHNTYLKVTTAKYYIPSGRCVQAIDYAKRNDDGSIQRIPDSLTNEFKTRNGRVVRDGCGIMPDIELERRSNANIAYFLYIKNAFFDYATKYAYEHKSILAADSFKITDAEYANFVEFVKSKNYKYELQSTEVLKDLKDIVKTEGYLDNDMEEKLNQIAQIIQPNIERDMLKFRPEIEELLGAEIVKRYYFQKGSIAFELKYDEWLHQAIEVFNDADRCQQLLH